MSPGPMPRLGRAWVRVLLAGIAVHLAGIVATAVVVAVYVIVAGAASADAFAAPVSLTSLAVLTLPAAAWAARGSRPGPGLLIGLAVGLLVAGMLGLLFFWPHDGRSAALFALIVAAGLAGGLIGGSTPPLRR